MSAAMLAALVTVILDGSPVEGSVPARIRDGVVVAPLVPYVGEIAERIESDCASRWYRIVRGERSISIRIGSQVGRNGAGAEALPIAPYLRAGDAIIPLAVVARALGAAVAYDARSHTLHIDLVPQPLVTLTPSAYVPPPPGSVPTFAPPSSPSPRPTVTGIPKPRRTPILIESSEP